MPLRLTYRTICTAQPGEGETKMKQFKLSETTVTKPNDRYWTFCVGSGHAALALRKDYLDQLKRAHDELGFQRVRFHGVLDDDMKVVTRLSDYLSIVPGSKKVRTTSFYQISVVFDELLKIGIKPFVEVGFMPGALAKGGRTVFYYKGNITQPKRIAEWNALVKQFVEFLIDRYGREEVESWYFEIWNEPDLRVVFFAGSQKDYFRLYRETANTIKAVDPAIRVGGPATSQNRWIGETKQYCEQNGVPLDFLSTHHYPGDDIGLPIFTKENISRMGFSALKNPGSTVHDVINKMMYTDEKLPLIKRDSMVNQAVQAKKEAGDTPLFYTEWNVCPTCTAPLHDTAQSAAYVVKHTMDCQYIMDASSFWTFSDIFEELTFFTEPFSGSFGLMNVNGIPKPSYWAFYMMNRLGEERFCLPTTHEPIELAAFRSADGSRVQLLVYRQNFCEGSSAAEDVEIRYETAKPVSSATVMKIDRTHCNPKQMWVDMGSPDSLKPDEVEAIKAATKLTAEPASVKQEDGAVTISAQLADNDVRLIELTF